MFELAYFYSLWFVLDSAWPTKEVELSISF